MKNIIKSCLLKASIPCYLLMNSFYANAALTRTKTVLETFMADIRVVAPVIGALVLSIVGLMYMKKLASNETLIRWAIGALIFGSSGEIASMFFG